MSTLYQYFQNGNEHPPFDEIASTNETGGETHSLTGREPSEVNSASSGLSAPVTSEEVDGQIKAVTDPLSKQLERLCKLMRDLRQVSSGRNEETTGLIHGPSRPHNICSDNVGIGHFSVIGESKQYCSDKKTTKNRNWHYLAKSLFFGSYRLKDEIGIARRAQST